MDNPQGVEKKIRIKDIFQRTFFLYGENFPLFLAVSILANFTTILSLKHLTWLLPSGARILLYGLGVGLQIWGLLILIYMSWQRELGHFPDLNGAIMETSKNLLRGMAVHIFVSLLMSLGFLLLVLPGVYWGTIFSLAIVLIVTENSSFSESFRRSIRLIRGHFGVVLGIYFLSMILLNAGNVVYFFNRDYGFRQIFTAVYSIVMYPFWAVLLTQVYMDLKKIKGADYFLPEQTGPRRFEFFGGAGALILAVTTALMIFAWGTAGKVFLKRGQSARIKSVESGKTQGLFTAVKPDLISLSPDPQIIENPAFTLYVPSGIDLTQRFPLVVALSPNANAAEVLGPWKPAAEQYKWLVLASKEYRNKVDMRKQTDRLVSILDWVVSSFPVDPNRVVASGFSGGGMGAHGFSVFYPDIISGVVVNTGMMHSALTDKNKYPRDKLAVLLASPTDFRYEEMKRDRRFLEDLGWETNWIEFAGGHQIAPAEVYQKAAGWMLGQWDSPEGKVNQDSQGSPADDVSRGEWPETKSGELNAAEGMVREYSPEGILATEVRYSQGLRNGPYRSYYPDGTLWGEGNFRNDQKDGVFKVYNTDGSLQSETSYRNGRRHGTAKEYQENNVVLLEETYDNGEKVYEAVYNKWGRLVRESNFKNNQRNSQSRIDDSNGNVVVEMEYEDGNPEGLLKGMMRNINNWFKRNKKGAFKSPDSEKSGYQPEDRFVNP